VAAFVAERVPPDGCVVLIGGVDAGKTTLARALHRLLGGEVVDADLGQSTIGSPTAITLGTYDGGMRDGYFVGDTTPRGHLVLALCGALRMARRARRPLVVDTDGYIAGNAGRSYKLALIEALDPDLVVLLPKGMELELLRLSCEAETVCVRVSGVRQDPGGADQRSRGQLPCRVRPLPGGRGPLGGDKVAGDAARVRGACGSQHLLQDVGL